MMFFQSGSLYKISVLVPIRSLTQQDEDWEKDTWLDAGDLINILEIHGDHFIVHSQFGVFKTSNFYSYVNFEEHFEKIA